MKHKKKRIVHRLITGIFLTALNLAACGREEPVLTGSTADDCAVLEQEGDNPYEERSQNTPISGRKEQNSGTVLEEQEAEAIAVREIFVHICGAVVEPGVYRLKDGSRLYEVILLAGGLRADAADQSVNQAAFVTDGMQIYIPTREENPAETAAGALNSIQGGSSGGISDGLVNINTADVTELCTLPGIGESRARAIIEYREANGAFGSIEELMRVSGIKSGIYEQIKDYIKV